MIIALVILYMLALGFTFYQATWWGFCATSCPRENVTAIERYILLYEIYGISFIILLALPLIGLLVWGTMRFCQYIRRRNRKNTLPI